MPFVSKVVMVGAIALGAALTGQIAAAAEPDAATVTVSPASDLNDGATVAVGLAGFPANETIFTVQCAQPADVVVCNPADAKQTVTDANGNASTSLTVRRTYTGFTADGREWGVVDCTTAPNGCGVFSVNASATAGASAGIWFK